jgi:hypothetical protein
MNCLITVLTLLCISIFHPTTGCAQLLRSVDLDEHGFPSPVATLSVTPSAAIGADRFRYRLKLLPSETVHGNAAMNYASAFAGYSFFKNDRANFKEFEEDYAEWSGGKVSLSDIPMEKLKVACARFDEFIDNHIAVATRCRECDWGVAIEDLRGKQLLQMDFPAIRSASSISWTLVLKTRAAIKQGEFEKATDLLRMHYTLAQNVSRLNNSIAILTAIQCLSRANMTLLEFVAQPDAPNMYWAIAQLPHPIISGVAAMETQMAMFENLVPEFKEIDESQWSDQRWKRVAMEVFETFSDANNLDSSSGGTGKQTNAKTLFLKASLTGVTAAKKRLLAAGTDTANIEKMSVSQVMLLDAKHEYEKAKSEFQTMIYMPIPDSILMQRRRNEAYSPEALQNNLGANIFSTFGPLNLHQQVAEVQQELDLIRIIEAIRLHAADTGSLPLSLDEIKSVSIPLDPWTGKPFDCQLTLNKAEFTLNQSAYERSRFVIKLNKTTRTNQGNSNE